MAVNAGVAYVGNVGGSVVDFTALGDPVNVSARMQQHAAGGELLVASGVADQLMAKTPRRALNLRGHEQPIDAFVLAQESMPTSPASGHGLAPAHARSCSGRSGSILMPSSSQVPLMAPTMIVVRCATNSSAGIRRGLSSSAPSHQSVAEAAVPKVANAASSIAAPVELHLAQLVVEHVGHRQGDVAALVQRPHRGLGLVGEPALHQEPHDVRVLVDQVARTARRCGGSTSRAGSVARLMDGKIAAHNMSRSRSPIAWNRSDLSVKCR